jgi:hypothetical protein
VATGEATPLDEEAYHTLCALQDASHTFNGEHSIAWILTPNKQLGRLHRLGDVFPLPPLRYTFGANRHTAAIDTITGTANDNMVEISVAQASGLGFMQTDIFTSLISSLELIKRLVGSVRVHCIDFSTSTGVLTAEIIVPSCPYKSDTPCWNRRLKATAVRLAPVGNCSNICWCIECPCSVHFKSGMSSRVQHTTRLPDRVCNALDSYCIVHKTVIKQETTSVALARLRHSAMQAGHSAHTAENGISGVTPKRIQSDTNSEEEEPMPTKLKSCRFK